MKHDLHLRGAKLVATLPWAANIPPVTNRLSPEVVVDDLLVLVDAENLMLSALDLGHALDFAALRQALCPPQARLACHAFYSQGQGDAPLADHLAERGWRPHVRPPIHRNHGQNRGAHLNADTWFAFGAAHLMAASHYGCVVLGTGDGLLGLDVARCIRNLFPNCRTIATLSCVGSTSKLLDARTAPEIDFNIEVGRDALRRLH